MIVKSALRTCFVLLCVLSRNPAAAASLPADTDSDYEIISSSQSSKKSFQRSLSGLYSIPSWRQSQITQPHDDFDSLYQQAHQAQTELEQLIQQISLSTDTQSQLPGIKSLTRAKYKISTELDGEVNRLTDLARGSLIASDIGSLVQAFELLSKKVTIVEVRNRFKQPATSGYRDLKMLVRLPQTQHVAEIQLHLQAISDIKNGVEHKIYEQLQTIERTASSQNRELNELEVSQINSLRNISINLYQSVWQQYLRPETMAS